MKVAMATPPSLDQLADRVERLLLRYEEMQRTNALLERLPGTNGNDADKTGSGTHA